MHDVADQFHTLFFFMNSMELILKKMHFEFISIQFTFPNLNLKNSTIWVIWEIAFMIICVFYLNKKVHKSLNELEQELRLPVYADYLLNFNTQIFFCEFAMLLIYFFLKTVLIIYLHNFLIDSTVLLVLEHKFEISAWK